MVVGRHLLSEFSRRITGDVDLSPETCFGLPKRRGEVRQAHGADHKQVHVAQRMFLTSGNRTVDEGTIDTRLERLQCLLERWQQPRGLFDKTV